MAEAVLDASAVLAFLQGEPGGDLVYRAMPSSCMSAVNAAEIVSKLVENGLSDRAACDAVSMLPVEIVPFDETSAYQAGLLHRATRGRNVSLGDRACLALAQRLGLPALTTDRSWLGLGLNIEVGAVR